MGINPLVAFNVATDTLRQSAQNLESIRQARAKLEMEKEKFANDKKIVEAQIKNYEITGEKTRFDIQKGREEWDYEKKAKDFDLKAKESLLDGTEYKQAKLFDTSKDAVVETMPQAADYFNRVLSGTVDTGGGENPLLEMSIAPNRASSSVLETIPEKKTVLGYSEGKIQPKEVSNDPEKYRQIKRLIDSGIPVNDEERGWYDKYRKDNYGIESKEVKKSDNTEVINLAKKLAEQELGDTYTADEYARTVIKMKSKARDILTQEESDLGAIKPTQAESDARSQAIEELKKIGYPPTEKNIAAAIKQLKKK